MTGLQDIASRLDAAAQAGKLIPMLDSPLSMTEAYQVQRLNIERRVARGERLIGYKMGLTSRAKMKQMGIDTPIFGRLTSAMQVGDGGTIDRRALCHPRIEPEIAFLLGRDLAGPVTPAEALLAIIGVCPALEIIDSRYENFKFTLPDVIADNASSAAFVLGSRWTLPGVPMDNLGVVLEVNGRVVETGSSSAVLDHPLRSLAEQARLLASLGEGLRAGQVVLTGGVTAAVNLEPGSWVRVSVDRLGTASCRTLPAC
ncbi:MAG TPA: fumarylacetoacetate hydrolase family protein [Candidatus Xenobia bacterium]|jgi:2-oxo-3-hexenedioate decarboxylase